MNIASIFIEHGREMASRSLLLVLELLYTAILCFVGCCCLVLKRNNAKALENPSVWGPKALRI